MDHQDRMALQIQLEPVRKRFHHPAAVLVSMDAEHGRDGLQLLHDGQGTQIAGMQDEVDSLKTLRELDRERKSGNMGIRHHAYLQ